MKQSQFFYLFFSCVSNLSCIRSSSIYYVLFGCVMSSVIELSIKDEPLSNHLPTPPLFLPSCGKWRFSSLNSAQMYQDSFSQYIVIAMRRVSANTLITSFSITLNHQLVLGIKKHLTIENICHLGSCRTFSLKLSKSYLFPFQHPKKKPRHCPFIP